MNRTHRITKTNTSLKRSAKWLMGLIGVFLWGGAMAQESAGGVIPIATDVTQKITNKGFSEGIMFVFAQKIIPFMQLASGVLILFFAISAILSGVQEAKVERNWSPMKDKIIISVLLVVIGGVFIALLGVVGTHFVNDANV